MSNDEKMCPLTKMTCYGSKCALWHTGDRDECYLARMMRTIETCSLDVFWIRKALEDNL